MGAFDRGRASSHPSHTQDLNIFQRHFWQVNIVLIYDLGVKIFLGDYRDVTNVAINESVR